MEREFPHGVARENERKCSQESRGKLCNLQNKSEIYCLEIEQREAIDANINKNSENYVLISENLCQQIKTFGH